VRIRDDLERKPRTPYDRRGHVDTNDQLNIGLMSFATLPSRRRAWCTCRCIITPMDVSYAIALDRERGGDGVCDNA
jgi:hypothetical protein